MMFDKFRELYQFQKKARVIQKELRNTEIEASALEGKIKVIFSGEQKVQKIEFAEEILQPERKRELERGVEDAIREAVTKSQQIAAEKMKAITGDLNIPGM